MENEQLPNEILKEPEKPTGPEGKDEVAELSDKDIELTEVEIINNEQGSFLRLLEVKDEDLPTVTIVTPTYKREDTFEIAVRNYKNFNYPRDKLFWKILDDSPTNKIQKLLPEYDNTIEYIHYKNEKNETSEKVKMTIGKKRNILASKCTTEVICHMDDDDFYYADSVKIRVIAMMTYKKPVSGCLQYNCYNIIDDSQFIARSNKKIMNIGEASLCYMKKYWDKFKFNDEDTYEESVYFFGGKQSNFVNVPCFWIMLNITHKNNLSGRKAISPILNFSFLDTLSVDDFEFIKSIKLKLMLKDKDNEKALKHLKEIQNSKNPEKIIDKLSIDIRKNIFIREYLNVIPTKTTCSAEDYLIICMPGQFMKELNFEKETELIEFVKANKNKYRFTIYTDCEKGYSFSGITLSPYWKWRTGNKYNKCLIYCDPSYLKYRINANELIFYNKYDFNTPEMKMHNNLTIVKELSN